MARMQIPASWQRPAPISDESVSSTNPPSPPPTTIAQLTEAISSNPTTVPPPENISKQHKMLQILRYDTDHRPGITQHFISNDS